jgi:cyanate permease
VKQKRPEYYGLLPDGAAVGADSETAPDALISRGVEYAAGLDEKEFTFRQAIKTSSYWLLSASWLFYTIVTGAINIHIIPFLTDMGISEAAAGGLMAMMVFFTVPARFLGGVLADRVRKNRLQYLAAGAFLLQTIGIVAFLLHQSIVTVYVFLIFYGLGSGAPTPLRLTVGGRYFGRKAFASIQGSSMAMTVPTAFFAPVYAGWVYDTTGSYNGAFVSFAIMSALSALLMLLVRPPKAPEQVTDITRFM